VFDIDKFNAKEDFLAGCDEVGRGPLAGPVVAASVYIESKYVSKENLNFLLELGVTDSKKISAKKRAKIIDDLKINLSKTNQKVTLEISKKFIIHFSIREVSNELIDEINILRASLLAMSLSFKDCKKKTDTGRILIDGNKLLELEDDSVTEEFVIKGDSKSVIIGLASVIAKEYRDQLMKDLGEKYPGYGLEGHAGYPTKAHKEAIKELGITPIHRKSFKGVKEYCQFN